MPPEDITLQLEGDWAAYIRRRRRRIKACSWIDGVSHRYKDAVTSIKTMITAIILSFVFGFAYCITPLSPVFVSVIIGIPLASITIYGIIRLVCKIIRPVDYAEGIGREMAGFLKHHHGRLKTFYKVFMLSNKKYREYFDDDYMTLDKSVYYGFDKVLSTIWSCQTCDSSNVFGIDGLYEDDVYTTYQLIRFMWANHRSPLLSSRHETGLLIRAWSDLSVDKIGWKEYYEIVNEMALRVKREANIMETTDKNSILERLDSIKHDSDVVNGSPDVARMRGLIGRVHDSGAELSRKTAS